MDTEQALRMIDAFVSVGATNFDLSLTRCVNGPDGRPYDEKVPGKQLTNAHFREAQTMFGHKLDSYCAKCLNQRPQGNREWKRT